MTAKLRITAAAAAATALTALIVLTVHSVLFARIGTLPVALSLWAVFAAGAWLVLRLPGRWAVALIVVGGIAMQLAALSAGPQGSDDLYRYIWDGRVQAAGIDPYQYAPPRRSSPRSATPSSGRARPVLRLRRAAAGRLDPARRPRVHQDQPSHRAHHLPAGGRGLLPGRALPVAGRERDHPDPGGRGGLRGPVTLLLLYGLPKVGRDRRLAVLWAWCPTVALEAGNNGHVDVLAAGLTAAALILLARPGSLSRPAGAGFAAGPLRRP